MPYAKVKWLPVSQASLISGNNLLTECEIHDWSHWKRTYQPGLSWSGVGNNYTHNIIYNAPHAGILGGGNVFSVLCQVYILSSYLHES